MGRLIDVDVLNAKLRNIYENEKDVINSVWMLNTLIDKVDEIPTAYDQEKVVWQLEDRSVLSRPVGWLKSYEIITLAEAIDIVKGGGANGD